MMRALYTPDGYFLAAHSLILPEPTQFAWALVEDGEVETLSTHHKFMDGVWVLSPPIITLADAQATTRKQRDRLLLACDWTQLPDVPAATQTAWGAYRQALRDVTTQPDQFAIVWPNSPKDTAP